MYRIVSRGLMCGLLTILILPAAVFGGMPKAQLPSADDRCPVCGMFVHKYPDWTGQIRFKSKEVVFFDGAKDLFKYYFSIGKYHPGRSPLDIMTILVTDYYSVTFTDAVLAFFVVGSDVYGPMGRELIPFSSPADARAFLTDHHGKEVLGFYAITPELLRSLD